MLYFAYGSNMLHERLAERVGNIPPARPARTLGYRFRFNKRGRDGSGKCNLNDDSEIAETFGGLYQLSGVQLDQLVLFEPGYGLASIEVELDGAMVRASTFIAEPDSLDDSLLPFDWYRRLVIRGAVSLQLPQNYIAQLALGPR